MKKIVQKSMWVLILVLIIGNIYFFLKGLTLSDQITTFEIDITKLKDENIDMERKVYEAQSFSHAASMAAVLQFTKKSSPIYIDNILYANNF